MFRCPLFSPHHRQEEQNIMEKKTEKIAEKKLEKQELKVEELDLVAGGVSAATNKCVRCGKKLAICKCRK